MRSSLRTGTFALVLLGCGVFSITTGIRGRLPIGEGSWIAGQQICASKHEVSDEPVCATIGRDGAFELALEPGVYWLCEGIPSPSRCNSLCPYKVSSGEVTEVDPSDLLTPKPAGQGLFGTSTGSFAEPDYLDLPHPLQVCVGPPDTPVISPVASLTCAETDRCGRYTLSIPEGDYRVLFAEIGSDHTNDRRPCRYRIGAGELLPISHVTSRGAVRITECGDLGTPDPIGEAEIVAVLREFAAGELMLSSFVQDEITEFARRRMQDGAGVEQIADHWQVDVDWLLPILLREMGETERSVLPARIQVEAGHIAFRGEAERGQRSVTIRGDNFRDEEGTVSLRAVGTDAWIDVPEAQVNWSDYEISFSRSTEVLGGRYQIRVTRPDGRASHPRDAVVVLPDLPESETTPAPEPVGAAGGPTTLTSAQIKTALETIKPAARKCGAVHGVSTGSTVAIHFTVSGFSGAVTSATPLVENELGECVAEVGKTATFPKFHAATRSFTFTFRM